MLLELDIHNIALIDSLRIELTRGLNALTGETGAGKSIVVDSVNLALGHRGGREMVRAGTEKARVRALFDIGECGKAKQFLDEIGIEYDDGFAESYANSTSTDENGNKTYEFSGPQYDNYVNDHKSNVTDDIQKYYVDNHEKGFGQYVYINTENKSVIVGLNSKKEYDEKTASEEAKKAAEYGFKFFQNLKEPVDDIKVVYCNASDQSDIYGSFDFSVNG